MSKWVRTDNFLLHLLARQTFDCSSSLSGCGLRWQVILRVVRCTQVLTSGQPTNSFCNYLNKLQWLYSSGPMIILFRAHIIATCNEWLRVLCVFIYGSLGLTIITQSWLLDDFINVTFFIHFHYISWRWTASTKNVVNFSHLKDSHLIDYFIVFGHTQ